MIISIIVVYIYIYIHIHTYIHAYIHTLYIYIYIYHSSHFSHWLGRPPPAGRNKEDYAQSAYYEFGFRRV